MRQGEQGAGLLFELTSHKKTKSRQQQRPQHGGHGSPDSRPAAATQARRSAPIAAAASRTKCNNSNKVRAYMWLLMAFSGHRFHPGDCWLLSDQISLTLSCRSAVVSFRREEAAPLRGASSSSSSLPPSPPPPPSASIVVVVAAPEPDCVTRR